MSQETDEMKAALIAAGKTVRSNASEESIREAYTEWQIEDATVEGAPEETVTPEVSATPSVQPRSNKEDAYLSILAAANPQMGDKDPIIIQWCRDNLSADEFSEKYDGRKYSL